MPAAEDEAARLGVGEVAEQRDQDSEHAEQSDGDQRRTAAGPPHGDRQRSDQQGNRHQRVGLVRAGPDGPDQDRAGVDGEQWAELGDEQQQRAEQATGQNSGAERPRGHRSRVRRGGGGGPGTA